MKGTVEIFNAVKGVGFLRGEDGIRYFFHQNKLMMPGFRAIAVGEDVVFTVASTLDERPFARGVDSINETKVHVVFPPPRVIMLDNGVAALRVDTWQRIYAKEDLFPFGEFVIAPSVWVKGAFRAFKTDGMIKGFTLRLPTPTRERVFLALDPSKAPLSSTRELRLDPGSYILSLEGNGDLDVQAIGRRYQDEKGGGNWVVLEHRLRQILDLQKEIEGQLPTSGLARDNDGFIPAIKEAIHLLGQGVTVS